MFPSASALAVTSGLVSATMPETVTLVRPGTATRNIYGEAVPGAPADVATVRARVTPEAAPERVEADRLTGGGTYTVRVDLTALTAQVDAAWTLRWERDARRGGPLALAVTGTVDDHSRGRFLDILCGVRTPAATAGVAP